MESSIAITDVSPLNYMAKPFVKGCRSPCTSSNSNSNFQPFGMMKISGIIIKAVEESADSGSGTGMYSFRITFCTDCISYLWEIRFGKKQNRSFRKSMHHPPLNWKKSSSKFGKISCIFNMGIHDNFFALGGNSLLVIKLEVVLESPRVWRWGNLISKGPKRSVKWRCSCRNIPIKKGLAILSPNT